MSAKPSAQDEAAFMKDLLSGIDSSFFDNTLSPEPSPKKRKRACELAEPVHTPIKTPVNTIVTSEQNKNKQHLYDVPGEEELTALLEGAEDWDWDDTLSPVKKKPKSEKDVPSSQAEESMLRCVVESVRNCGSSKELQVIIEDRKTRKTVVLKDDWVQTEVQTGDTLNVIGVFSPQDHIITISSKCNLLIQHPDILMTATSVANALHCSRRPLLSLLMRSQSDKSRSLVWGNLLHEVMQRCLTTGRWDASNIEMFVDEGIQKNLIELVHIGVGVEEARAEINRRAIGLKAFGEKYWGETPKAEAVVSTTSYDRDMTPRLAVTRLNDVEEEIWVPKYGLKGKIDASIQVRIDEHPKSDSAKHKLVVAKPCTTSADVPLEIKTGLAVAGMEHRAQTMLYSLLMTERYESSLPKSLPNSRFPSLGAGGLLFYTQSEELIRVPTGWNELRGLIMARNELARYLMRRSRQGMKTAEESSAQEKRDEVSAFLPPTIDQERTCGRCYVSDACMLYRKAVENVQDDFSPIADIYELKTGHLSQKQLDFFKHWENLISLEEQDMSKFRKELWTMGAKERERSGRCLANMVLDTTFRARNFASDMRIHRFTYRFVRQRASVSTLSACQSLLNGHIASGDPVVISVSDDPRLLALARGYVLELTPEEVVIGVDHSLSSDFIRSRSPRYGPGDGIVFRIDRDDLLGGMGRVRDNLAQLFYITGSRRLLECIVDLKPPMFDEVDIATGTFENLNQSQVHAVNRALQAKDYALILGMPGTGKTTTVAYMIRRMVEMGKTVLLTSYTHSAVDTILLKLKDIAQFEILRLGNKDKIHPEVQKFTLDAREPPATIEELEHRLLRPPVVSTTALSTDHALFSRRRFDYCIVDEASQITLPTCIGPLRFADRFILVGDHFQLPPLVRSKEARKSGFDVSLFRRLSDAHPHAVVDLTYQYRMNADIMLLSNKLIYSDRLKCGSPEVANRSLGIPRMRKNDCSCGSKGSACWLRRVMDESCKAVFVDTDELPAFDSLVGDLIQNETEASLVRQVTLALLEGGVREEQIGIISLYRQQIKLLSHLLREYKDIEILTADRSQGRDKDCIIISLVRANKDNQLGDLLKDWRRVNVAFTRARAKLVIFGSRNTLKASPLLSDFFDLMEGRGWVLKLPAGSDITHSRQDAASSPPATSIPKESSSKAPIKRENLSQPKKAKQASVTTGLLRSRPILRDILNDGKARFE